MQHLLAELWLNYIIQGCHREYVYSPIHMFVLSWQNYISTSFNLANKTIPQNFKFRFGLNFCFNFEFHKKSTWRVSIQIYNIIYNVYYKK